jgi:hypothetical protein
MGECMTNPTHMLMYCCESCQLERLGTLNTELHGKVVRAYSPPAAHMRRLAYARLAVARVVVAMTSSCRRVLRRLRPPPLFKVPFQTCAPFPVAAHARARTHGGGGVGAPKPPTNGLRRQSVLRAKSAHPAGSTGPHSADLGLLLRDGYLPTAQHGSTAEYHSVRCCMRSAGPRWRLLCSSR